LVSVSRNSNRAIIPKFPNPSKMSQNIEKLTSVLLNGKNYHLWIRQATFGLIGRDRLEHVNGEKLMPQLSIPPLASEMKVVKAWLKDDNQTCSLLIVSN
jgi:hypothetical protein